MEQCEKKIERYRGKIGFSLILCLKHGWTVDGGHGEDDKNDDDDDVDDDDDDGSDSVLMEMAGADEISGISLLGVCLWQWCTKKKDNWSYCKIKKTKNVRSGLSLGRKVLFVCVSVSVGMCTQNF